MDYSVISVLPCELYAIPSTDFLLLCKDLLPDFKRYNKPYPSERQIKQLYDQERKWKEYKEYLLKSIMINKKMSKGSSFDYVLRQADVHIPKKVNYLPDLKIKLQVMKKKDPKEVLHHKFMRTDSENSLME
mmetsp:Transcript_13568/g.13310  ORF Transcript_13568/g.13310 Transcript_13568/m.13310 type:complete len:131 (+) Transcript_13568:950-1342(+)